MITEPVVTVRCIACHATREVRAGEVAPNDVPMCDACLMPMVVVRAEKRGKV